MSWAYVGSVYISPFARTNRDGLSTMIQRMIGVIIMTAAATWNFGYSKSEWLQVHVEQIYKTLGLITVLYLPQLIHYGIPKHEAKTWTDKVRILRDLVIGPLTEELLFRAVLYDIYDEAHLSSRYLSENFWYFGCAHIHHGLMAYFEGSSAVNAFVNSLLQFFMTSIFGSFSSMLFLNTKSIWPCIFAHSLCNFYGPPRIQSVPALGFNILSLVVFAYCLRYF